MTGRTKSATTTLTTTTERAGCDMKIEVEDLLKYSIVISIDDSVYDRFKHLFLYHSLTPCPRLYRGMKLHGVDWGSDSIFASFG